MLNKVLIQWVLPAAVVALLLGWGYNFAYNRGYSKANDAYLVFKGRLEEQWSAQRQKNLERRRAFESEQAALEQRYAQLRDRAAAQKADLTLRLREAVRDLDSCRVSADALRLLDRLGAYSHTLSPLPESAGAPPSASAAADSTCKDVILTAGENAAIAANNAANHQELIDWVTNVCLRYGCSSKEVDQ